MSTTVPSLAYLQLQIYSLDARDHRNPEDFFAWSSCPLIKSILEDEGLDEDSIVSYLMILFLEWILEMTIYFQYSKDVFEKMWQESRILNLKIHPSLVDLGLLILIVDHRTSYSLTVT